MAVTANDVKTLREMTGVGMMDCKKALAEANGDMDKAVELLREKGLAASQKKAGRIAAEAWLTPQSLTVWAWWSKSTPRPTLLAKTKSS